MKKYLLPLLCLMTIVASAQPEPPTIEVWGTAEILTPPDLVEFTLSLDSRSHSQKEALDDNNGKLSRLRRLVSEFAVDPKTLAVENLRTFEDRRNHPSEPQAVTRRVRFLLADPDQKSNLVERLIKENAGGVNSTKLLLNDPAARRNEARQMALLQARKKAEAMAATLGERIGRPYRIQEIPAHSWNSGTASNVVANSGDTTGQSERHGQISTKSSVKVVFGLQP